MCACTRAHTHVSYLSNMQSKVTCINFGAVNPLYSHVTTGLADLLATLQSFRAITSNFTNIHYKFNFNRWVNCWPNPQVANFMLHHTKINLHMFFKRYILTYQYETFERCKNSSAHLKKSISFLQSETHLPMVGTIMKKRPTVATIWNSYIFSLKAYM